MSERRSLVDRILGLLPWLSIQWNTYPSHIGHRQTTQGCFRCHQVLAEGDREPDLPKRLLQPGMY